MRHTLFMYANPPRIMEPTRKRSQITLTGEMISNAILVEIKDPPHTVIAATSLICALSVLFMFGMLYFQVELNPTSIPELEKEGVLGLFYQRPLI